MEKYAYRMEKKLGIWPLCDWSLRVCANQLLGLNGVYCILNIHTNKRLIGEGNLNIRLRKHITLNSKNTQWIRDIKRFGLTNFILEWIIREEDEIERKIIEHEFHCYF